MDETDLNSFLTELAGNATKPEVKPPPKEETEETEEVETEESEGEETEEAQETTEQSEESDATEDEVGEESEDEEKDDVLSQIDLEQLTKEEKVELAEKLGSGLGKEVAGYRKEAKEAKEALESAQKTIAQLKGKVSGPMPYAEATTLEALEEAVTQDRKYKNELFAILEQDPVYKDEEMQEGPLGYKIANEFYTAKEVKDYLRQIDTKIEQSFGQRDRLRNQGQHSDKAKQALEEVKQYRWFENESSDSYTKWKEMMESDDIALVKEISPSIAAQLPAFIAAWVDKQRPAKSLKLPIKRKSPTSVGGGDTPGKGKRLTPKQAALKRVESGEYSDDDILKAYF